MINENTLRKLNNLGFGADINSLESYIVDFKQARLVSNLAFYSNSYEESRDMLEEINSRSLALTGDTQLEELELDMYDELFEKHKNFYKETAYSIKDSSLDSIRQFINDSENKSLDILGIANIKGINIKCSYINGRLYRIYLIGETQKYTDVTQLLKDKLPSYIEEFKGFKILELRGKITISDKYNEFQKYSKLIECSIMRFIRLHINIEKLCIVIDNVIISEDIEFPFDTQWDMLESLRKMGIEVPYYLLIRNIDTEELNNAVIALDESFDEAIESNEIDYTLNGINIRINSDLIDKNTIIYNSKDSKNNNIYESIVKSLSTIHNSDNTLTQVINIIKVNCNDKHCIDCIKIKDVYDVEKYKISIGEKIRFKTIENEAILI